MSSGHSSPVRRIRNSGISFLEVLIALGVIALIAAVLFPVLRGAQKKAKVTTCLSNLGQIGHALAMYAAEHDETLPPYWLHSLSLQYSRTKNRYKIIARPKEWRESVLAYAGNGEILWCPLDMNRGTRFRGIHDLPIDPGLPGDDRHLYTSYDTVAMLGEEFVDARARTFVPRLSKIAEPSRKPYVHDVLFWDEDAPPGRVGEWQDVTILSSHGDSGGILYFDSHVEHHRIGEW